MGLPEKTALPIVCLMDLETAVSRIRLSFTKMNEAYQRPVFDEFAIIAFTDPAVKLQFYDGPNPDSFNETYADKTILIRRELVNEKTETGGEFGFTREAEGDSFDAYICLGPRLYLFCNNTEKAMDEVTRDPRWLAAQSEFLNLSQYFAANPIRHRGA